MRRRSLSVARPLGRPDRLGREPFTLPERPRPCTPADLTRRQREVVALVATGASLKQVAHDLGLTLGTVKRYLHNAQVRAGVEANAELVPWFLGYAPYSELKEAGVPLPPVIPLPTSEGAPQQQQQ